MLTDPDTDIALILMNPIKIKYKYQILLYFALLLIAISLGFSYILVQKEKSTKMDRLLFQMHPYTDLIYKSITKDTINLSNVYILEKLKEISYLLPSEMRITILNPNGWVLFDNFSGKEIMLENHMTRPELIAAKSSEWGSALRFSETLNSDFLYYAKKYPELYIRTALEYKSSVKPLIKSDNRFIYIYIIPIFAYLSFADISHPVYQQTCICIKGIY